MMNVSLISFLFTILSGVFWGKMVEDDDDDNVSAFGYAVNTGAEQETTSRLPYGIIVAGLELLRSPGAFVAMYNDSGSIFNLAADAYKYPASDIWSADTGEAPLVTRGSYQNLNEYQRDLLKASSVLIPDLSINNIYKNLNADANLASARWYNQQFPVNIVNYIPQIGSTTKTNPTTQMFADYDVYGESRNFWEFIKDLTFSAHEY